MRISIIACILLISGLTACTTAASGGGQLEADARRLVTTSYQCQTALGREPHYSAIESSEVVLRASGKSADEAGEIVRGWLKEVIASPKEPQDLNAKVCTDRLLTLAEKVRTGYGALKKSTN